MPTPPTASWTYFETPAAEAIAAWLAAHPEGGTVVALVAEADAGAVPGLQQACQAGNVPLLGAVFPELIVASGFVRRGLLLSRMPAALRYRLITGLGQAPEAGVAKLTEWVDGQTRAAGADTLLLLFDAMVPNIASLLERLYDRLGDQVRYAGANAGSETFQPMPCLFDAEQLVGDAVLAVLLPDHPGAVLEHGYEGQGEVFLATGVEGNCISQIAWKPAFARYREIVHDRLGIEVTRDNFYQVAVHFPFGLVRADGQVLVRIPVALNDDDAIFCVGEIPRNVLLTILSGARPDASQTVEAIAAGLAAMPAGTPLLFYCAGRRLHLDAAAADEVGRLATALGQPVTGALSLGEIGNSRQGGYALFHNATLVALPWGAPR